MYDIMEPTRPLKNHGWIFVNHFYRWCTQNTPEYSLKWARIKKWERIIWVFLIVQDGFQMIPTVIGSNGFGATLNLNWWRLTPPSVRPQDMRYRLLGTVEQVMDSEMDVPELEDHGDPWRKDLGKKWGKNMDNAPLLSSKIVTCWKLMMKT